VEESAAGSNQDEILAKAETLSGYPSKVIITKKTNVQLMVDGKVSGSVVLPEGVELPVTGVDGANVIVEFGNALQKVPKTNTNFAEALVAEAEARQASESKISRVEPRVPPAPIKKGEAPRPLRPAPKKSQDSATKNLEMLIDNVKLLETIDVLSKLKGASDAEITRFMRSIDARWKRASDDSADFLASGEGTPSHKELLKKFIEASEMVSPNRLQMFDAKLKEIDKDWLKLKTEEKIQNITESQRE
jgi:hypothetical protein